MTTINQKEYLKKYLAIGKAPGEKKKKRKKEKTIGNRLKIIDDDVDVLMSKEIENDIATANEDAPQIVAVIDERPHSMQVDEKTNSSLWRPLGEPSTTETDAQNLKLNSFKLGKQVKQSDISSHYKKNNSEGVKVKEEDCNHHYSRKNDRENSNSYSKQDVSPLRKCHEDDDYSPPRKSVKQDSSSARKKDRDYSPPGKKLDDSSPPRRRNEDSSSPPRTRNKEDSSPPRRRNKEDSSSPRRRNEDDSSPPRKRNKEDSSSPRRRNKDDNSPPRRRIKEEDSSPPRRRTYEDNSPPRRSRNNNLGERRIERDDFSPKRKFKDGKAREEEKGLSSTPRSKSEGGDMSPSRRHKRKPEGGKKTRWGRPDSSEVSSGEKMKKTLDGKRAGLQNAKDLTTETKFLRQKEDELFNNMSAEVSGRNATTVIRGSKVKDPEEEAAKAKREREMKEKYDRWGKGLKQVEDQSKIIEEQLHEMSKPLARYADDEDLEKFLKEQERDGDPMLNYIRKKKRKEKVAAGVPEKPMYMGEFMPNRFGICPGYRWDGVDRSNGYEKKWFQVQNAKKADREEAFKWSTEDM